MAQNEIVTTNKKVGFWIRFTITFSDLFVFLIFLFAITFAMISPDKNNVSFRQNYLYYVWLSLIIIFIFSWWILIPFLTKGQTVIMWIFRVKIIPKKKKQNLFLALLSRQSFGAIFWIIIMLAWMILISPESFEQVAFQRKHLTELPPITRAFVTFPLSLTSLALLIEVMFILSVAKPNKIGWNDSLSQTYTVYKNKYTTERISSWDQKSVKPKSRPLPDIDIQF
ncbi:RDD family protein [Mycoplasma sp. 128]